jgi:hypothetical protein
MHHSREMVPGNLICRPEDDEPQYVSVILLSSAYAKLVHYIIVHASPRRIP